VQGVLGQVIPQVRQLFERLPVAAAAADADARFEHFRANVWPRIKETGAKGLAPSLLPFFCWVFVACESVCALGTPNEPPSIALPAAIDVHRLVFCAKALWLGAGATRDGHAIFLHVMGAFSAG